MEIPGVPSAYHPARSRVVARAQGRVENGVLSAAVDLRRRDTISLSGFRCRAARSRDDTAPLAERVRLMPQVAHVEISRRLPGTLVVTLRENLPVALAPSPRGLEPVDSAGVVLPIDPAMEDIDLPIANQRDKPILALL